MKTNKGMSGGPVFFEQDGKIILKSIHTGKLRDIPKGCLLTHELQAKFAKIINRYRSYHVF